MFLQNKKIVSILLIISMTLSSGSFRTFAEDVIESSIQKVTINTDKDIIEQETFNEVNKAPLKKIEEDTNDLDDNNFAEALEEVIISRDDDVVEQDEDIFGLSIGRFKIVTYDKEMILYHNDSQAKVDELKAFIDTHTAIAGWYVANFNDDFEHIVDSSRIVYSNDSLKTEIETWYQDNNMATVNKACGVIYRRYSCVPQDRGINELPSDEWEYVDDNRYLPSEYAYLNADGSEFINSMSIPVADFKIRNKVTNEIKRTKEWAVEDSNGATISFATKITKPTDLPFSHAGYGEIIYAGIALWPVFGDVEVKSFSIYGRGGGSIVLTPDMNYSDCVTEIDNLCDNSVRGFKLLYHDENEPSDMQKSDFGLHDTDFKNTTIKQLLDRFREWFFNPEYYVVYAATYGGVDYEIVYKMDNITQLPDITKDNRYPSGTSYRIEYTDTAPDVKISVQDYEALDTQFKNENNTSNIYLNIPGEASFFVQPYYTKEWNTAADGSGETYALGAAIKPEYFDANYNLVLYPIWEEVRLSQFYLNRSSQIKTVYAPKEKFNPTNLKINCSDGGSSVIEYSDDLVNAFIFEPSLDDELTVDDTKVTVTLKGRKIEGYNIDGTRPTMDRVKESLFGMIQDYIKDSVVLDLFAGSGQLGIEAISNGAKYTYFIDNNQEVIKTLNKNITNLKIKDKSKVILSDWKKSLNDFSNQKQKFNIIFVDPPYNYDVYEKILEKVQTLNLLEKEGLIILEHHNLKLKDRYNNLTLYKQKSYGNKSVNIYKID